MVESRQVDVLNPENPQCRTERGEREVDAANVLCLDWLRLCRRPTPIGEEAERTKLQSKRSVYSGDWRKPRGGGEEERRVMMMVMRFGEEVK
ncbi:hypothetical protein TWF718_001575 [Orbilia javanica]|uniref:Uncharacterized protein n=1 Tax=Orbilia javanica TaxID=47235 RepID=A0AAN8RSK8_9PEZI